MHAEYNISAPCAATPTGSIVSGSMEPKSRCKKQHNKEGADLQGCTGLHKQNELQANCTSRTNCASETFEKTTVSVISSDSSDTVAVVGASGVAAQKATLSCSCGSTYILLQTRYT